jgi:hypothetical protein
MKKTELKERVSESHRKLTSALEDLTEEQATRKGLNPQWSIKDALAHIAAWEIAGARMLTEIQNGTWKPQKINKEIIDGFNAEAVEARKEHSMPQVREEFDAAHREIERLIETLPDEVDESSPTYKYLEAVTFTHLTHHAAQIEKWKTKVMSEA